MFYDTDPKHVGTGVCIFREGEPGDCAYLIEAGSVEISSSPRAERDVLAVLGPGDVFGEMSLIDGQPRSATATTVDDCTLVPITRKMVESRLAHGDALTRLLLKVILLRFRNTQHGLDESKAVGETTLHEQTLQQVASELSLTMDLSQALKRAELEVHYQPIVHLDDARIAGFEALVRWKRGEHGYVPPLTFIPVAEAANLIVPLGRWVLDEACAALERIEGEQSAASLAPSWFMSVNVSTRQLYAEGETAHLLSVIRDRHLSPGRVKLEVTESVLLDDPKRAAEAIETLLGGDVQLAIDDFGTGYSSLSYLLRYPFHTLKIDRSFVDPLPEDEVAQRLIAAIVGIARALRLAVVAEGIESADQRRFLAESGCEYGQGYFFSKPLAEPDLREWVSHREATGADGAFGHTRPAVSAA